MKISGAQVFDPASSIVGEVRDIHISGGLVSDAPCGGETLDATGCVVMAGWIDMHAHPLAVSRLFALTGAGELAEWGDFGAIAREYLSLGITFFVEAGLGADEAEDAGWKCAGGKIGYGLLRLANGGGVEDDSGFIGRKFIGEKGVEDFLRHPPGANTSHVHLPHLAKGDSLSILKSFLEKLSGRRCHLSHLSHYAFESRGGRLLPAGRKAAKALAAHPNVTFDCGPVVFGPALTFTVDDELAGRVSKSGGGPLVRHEKSRFAASPYMFRKESYVDSLLWLNAMEMLLSAEDIRQFALAIDFPSGGAISGYPFIVACLMDSQKRNRFMETINQEAVVASALGSIGREFSLSEIVEITRTAPARICGLPQRGGLMPGSVADIVVYEKSADIERMVANPRYVILGGEVIIERGIWK